jgi:hypothetical protein
MNRKSEVIVYFATVNETEKTKWDILYHKPESLLRNLNKIKNKDEKNNFLKCPANTQFIKNIYVMHNMLESEYIIHEDSIEPVGESYVAFNVTHNPTLKNQKLIDLSIDTIFFTEEKDLEMSITSPFFSHTPHLQYGSLVPGRFNINKWFRNVNLEFNLWESTKVFKIGHLEPLVYFNFHTTKTVELKQFVLSDRARKIMTANFELTSMEKLKSLAWRYARFEKANMQKVIMNEISKNLLD